MAWLVYPRVWDLWTGTGAGNPTLAGTPPNTYVTLSSVPSIATNDTGEYLIANRDANEWEVGKLTYQGGNSFSRTPLKSSNAGAAVAFSTGTKDVFMCFASDVVSVGDEASIASAATVDLSTTAGARVLVTGTTTITSFGSGANMLRWVRFDNALTLTYDATALILPGAANITTSAGASALFASDASGNWRCVFYQNGQAREVLSADRTYFVRSDGSNNNTGRVNSAGGAFLTAQKAMDVIASTLDLAGLYTATVQFADATYTGTLTVKPCVGQAGPASLVFQGNAGTPGNVVLTVTSSDLVTLNPGSMAYFKDMELRTATSGNGVQVNSGTFYWSNIRFGAIVGAQISLFGPSLGFCQGNYSIVGAATYHLQAYNGGHFEIANRTITLTGTPAFTDFVYADSSCSVNIYGNTFSGSATGSRFNVTASSVIQTYGAGLTALPGNASGTADTATGGFYS